MPWLNILQPFSNYVHISYSGFSPLNIVLMILPSLTPVGGERFSFLSVDVPGPELCDQIDVIYYPSWDWRGPHLTPDTGKVKTTNGLSCSPTISREKPGRSNCQISAGGRKVPRNFSCVSAGIRTVIKIYLSPRYFPSAEVSRSQ